MTKSVLITGANRGLGECLVRRFAAEDWLVFAGRRGRESPLASADAGSKITWIALDVTSPADVRRARELVEERAGRLDVLINNAAINPLPEYDAPLGELDFDAIRRTLDVNAIGPLRVCQEFLPLLERGQRKLVVNVSSEAGSLRHSWRDRAYGYCMSKAALNMQTTILARALEPRGILALAVHPGWMRTDMGGPDATLDPAASAEGMYQLVMNAGPDTPPFVQHDGQPFPW